MNLLLSRRAWTSLLALLIAAAATLPACAADRKVRHRIPPHYPELARRMHIEGTVQVEAAVAPDGDVTTVRALGGNTLLGLAAVQAIRKWKFAPEDARSKERVEVDFHLID